MSETVFTYAAPGLKFGSGASAEIGYDLHQLIGSAAARPRVLLVTDPGVAATGHPARIAAQVTDRGLDVTTFDRARVEPTDESIDEAIAFARDGGPWDAIVAVGGGSAIDTAKAVNLLVTNEGVLLDYLNAPVGAGRAPSQPLLPLVAVPTTTGTGSESTTICVLDVLALKVKTGISHARLRPTLAVVDPDLTMSQPAMVTASCGMDILCHALESYTARWFADFDAKSPEQRVPYCGANPIADMWAEKSLSLLAGAFRTAVRDGDDAEARGQMALAATFAGLGFGNAGVHIPHANAYPIAGRVRDYRPEGYPQDEPIVPHGMAVSLTAPAAFAPHLRRGPRAPPAGGVLARRLLRRRRPRRPAVGAALVDARHRHPQRPRRGRLSRRRRRRPGRGSAQAAAAARDRTSRGDRRGPGRRLPRVHGALVTHVG